VRRRCHSTMVPLASVDTKKHPSMSLSISRHKDDPIMQPLLSVKGAAELLGTTVRRSVSVATRPTPVNRRKGSSLPAAIGA
jgi:hypothetical protein